MVSILDITTAFIYPIAFIFFVVLLVCIERMYRGSEETDKTDDTYVYKIDQLSTKTHKMTLKEIEAKLGYSVELVSEKEKE